MLTAGEAACMWGQGVHGKSVSSIQPCCEPNTAIFKKPITKTGGSLDLACEPQFATAITPNILQINITHD